MASPYPIDVAGVRLRSEQELIDAVRGQVHGSGPWTNWHDDVTTLDGLERALDDAGPLSGVMGREVASWLDADDVAIRSVAVAVAPRAARAIGVQALLEVLARRPERFAGVAPVGAPTSHPDLRWTLLQAISETVEPGDTDAIMVLRAAMREERGYWLLRGVARADLAWLLDHAAEVVPKDALGAGLHAMPDTARSVELIRRMAPWSPEQKATALDGAWWRAVPDADVLRGALVAT